MSNTELDQNDKSQKIINPNLNIPAFDDWNTNFKCNNISIVDYLNARSSLVKENYIDDLVSNNYKDRINKAVDGIIQIYISYILYKSNIPNGYVVILIDDCDVFSDMIKSKIIKKFTNELKKCGLVDISRITYSEDYSQNKNYLSITTYFK